MAERRELSWAASPCAVCVAEDAVRAISGAVSATSPTRRYCTSATSRESAPTSSAQATTAAEPPGVIPSAESGRVTRVNRASTSAAAKQSATVATVTRTSGTALAAIEPSVSRSR
nr:hypothetical protein [Sciscionella sp. SE31]